MSGIAGAVANMVNAATAGTGVTVSPLPAWGSIWGIGLGSTASQTIAGITATISVSAAITGTGILFYYLNSTFVAYTGAFNVAAGDTLLWAVEAPGAIRVSGTITVTNVTGAQTLGTIPYSIKLDSGV